MTSWLIPANTKIYDVFSAFAQDETYWPMNAKLSTNDTVFIYLAAPYKQIGFCCDVLETGYDLAKIYDQVAPFIKGEARETPSPKPFMKLKATGTMPLDSQSVLSLSKLRENGLNGMLMGARKLDNNPVLFGYIKGMFE
jgi:hypothetical protein